jgi:hypothetical protein
MKMPLTLREVGLIVVLAVVVVLTSRIPSEQIVENPTDPYERWKLGLPYSFEPAPTPAGTGEEVQES